MAAAVANYGSPGQITGKVRTWLASQTIRDDAKTGGS